MIKRNKRFNNLNNPVVFNTVGKFARVKDITKVAGENIEDFLKFLNEAV